MYYIRVNTIGKIEEVISSSPLEILVTDDYRLIEVNEEIFNEVRTSLYYWNSQLVKAPVAPDIFHEFNYELKQWQLATNYLSTIKTSNKEVINALSGDMILGKYPTYRQINYNREPTAPTTIEMNLWIDDIRAESNLANSSIDSATDLVTIEGIVDGFKAYLASL